MRQHDLPPAHTKQPKGSHTSKKPLFTESALPRPSNETFLSGGKPITLDVSSAR